jgi:hypothetical protein
LLISVLHRTFEEALLTLDHELAGRVVRAPVLKE